MWELSICINAHDAIIDDQSGCCQIIIIRSRKTPKTLQLQKPCSKRA